MTRCSFKTRDITMKGIVLELWTFLKEFLFVGMGWYKGRKDLHIFVRVLQPFKTFRGTWRCCKSYVWYQKKVILFKKIFPVWKVVVKHFMIHLFVMFFFFHFTPYSTTTTFLLCFLATFLGRIIATLLSSASKSKYQSFSLPSSGRLLD